MNKVNHSSIGDYHYYNMHDGKMLYLLTQHSQWNRKHHPFLLCTCKKGEGVVPSHGHVCRVITEEENVTLYDKSKQRFNALNGKSNANSKTYDVADHIKRG